MKRKGRFKDSPRSPQALRILARQRVALRLRTDGFHFDEIATAMKKGHAERKDGWPAVPPAYDRRSAHRDVDAALADETEGLRIGADKYRTLLARRAENGHRASWRVATDKQATGAEVLAAVGRCLDVSRHLADIYGLNAPKTFTGVSLTPEQLMAMSDEELDALHAKLAH